MGRATSKGGDPRGAIEGLLALMNLVLLRGGYPPVAVRPEDRLDYVRSLQCAQAGQGTESFTRLLYQRLDATFDEYLRVLQAS